MSKSTPKVQFDEFRDIQAALNGDRKAFDRLVECYERDITNQMWKYTHDRVELEELVQDVFVKAYLNLDSYRCEAPFLHWLRAIATRIGYDYWEKQKKAKKKQFIPVDEALDAYNETKDEMDLSSAASDILHAVFSRLSLKNRMVLTLQYLDNCSMQEIADRMGWTRAGAKMQAFRARSQLAKIIRKEGILEKLGWMK